MKCAASRFSSLTGTRFPRWTWATKLRDAAASSLSSKTINDLEKPGIRNLVRTELITIFNTILGKGMVSEIYLTEFAIQ